MAAGFWIGDYISSNLRSLWESPRTPFDEENPPQTIREVFERNLLSISEFCSCIDPILLTEADRSSGETIFLTEAEPFIQECLKAIIPDLEAFNFPISKEASDTLFEHLNLFDSIANGTKGLEENPEGKSCENSLIRLQFRKSCADFIEKKWTHGAAKNFYDLLLLSNRKERIQAAQVWTSQLLKDIPYLGNLKHNYFCKTFYPIIFVQSVEKAFTHQYDEALKRRLELIEKNSKWDPNFSERSVKAAYKKSQDDPSSLSHEEMAILEEIIVLKSLIDTASRAVSPKLHPIAEYKLKLLGCCVFNGHTLQGLGASLGEDRISQTRFTNIFSTLEALEDNWLFARKEVPDSSGNEPPESFLT